MKKLLLMIVFAGISFAGFCQINPQRIGHSELPKNNVLPLPGPAGTEEPSFRTITDLMVSTCDTIHYDGNPVGAVGIYDGATFSVAARYTPAILGSLTGAELTKVKIFIVHPVVSCVLKVWQAGTDTTPGIELYSQDISSLISILAWSEITLTTPLAITGNDLWVGYEVTNFALEYPAGFDAGPANPDGDWFNYTGTWEHMAPLGVDGNWCIRAVICSGGSSPMPVITTATTVTSCSGNVTVPVAVEDFNNIASASLVLEYDTSVLTYTGYANVNPALNGGILQIYNLNNQVRFGWISVTPATIAQGVLFEILFDGTEGTSGLNWDLVSPGNCEYTDLDGTVLPAGFYNGQAVIQHCLPSLTTVAGNYSGCDGQVVIPVDVTNFEEVASVSLKLQYDTLQLTFTGYGNVNPALATGMLVVDVLDGTVGIAWISVVPAFIGTGTLLDLNFTGIPGSSMLVWDTQNPGNCEFTDLDGNIFPGDFIDGVINIVHCLPTITTVAGNFTGCPGTFAIPVNVTNFEEVASLSLKLQYDTALLAYTGYGNVNPALATGMLVVDVLDGTVGIAWISVVPAFIGNGTLLDLNFTGTPGSSLLVWDTQNTGNCEYTDLAGTVFPAEFIEGEVVINSCSSISGVLTYYNPYNTPLNNSTVTLKNNGVIVRQTITDATGYYEFSDLPDGTYEVSGSTEKPWSGGNAADGLMCLKEYLGMISLTGLQLIVADVDNSTLVNAADALMILRRYVGMISAFPSGDWAFETNTVTLDGINSVVLNFRGLCFGDIDGSYIPEAKRSPAVRLIEEGIVTAKNGLAEIPVKLTANQVTGAVSLVLEFAPESMEILDVQCPLPGVSFAWHVNGNQLRLGWYSAEPLSLKAGEAIVLLKARVSSPERIRWQVGAESSIADGNAVEIQDVAIMIPKIVPDQGVFSLNDNYPDPFSRTTEISWSVPEAGQVTLKVMNLLGEEVEMPVNENQGAGTHTLTFDGSGLSKGIYLYRIEIRGIHTQFIQTKRMVKTE